MVDSYAFAMFCFVLDYYCANDIFSFFLDFSPSVDFQCSASSIILLWLFQPLLHNIHLTQTVLEENYISSATRVPPGSLEAIAHNAGKE